LARTIMLGALVQPHVLPVPARVHPAHAGGLSTAGIVLVALGAAVALGCLAWAAARTAALEPRWTLSLRHALAEAGCRASATWAEFSDWVRLGR
jgi:hypothetical protein